MINFFATNYYECGICWHNGVALIIWIFVKAYVFNFRKSKQSPGIYRQWQIIPRRGHRFHENHVAANAWLLPEETTLLFMLQKSLFNWNANAVCNAFLPRRVKWIWVSENSIILLILMLGVRKERPIQLSTEVVKSYIIFCCLATSRSIVQDDQNR